MKRFIEIETNPTPAGAEIGVFEAAKGGSLRTAMFPASEAKGTVIVATGWSEFIEKYFEVAKDLNTRGYNVAMMDWRGQGLSDYPPEWDGYFDLIADDLKNFREGPVAARFPGPCFLLTHSMGGLPTLLLLGAGYNGFERAALCAPLTKLYPGPMNVIINVAANVLSAVGFSNRPVKSRDDDANQFDGNIYTTDRGRHERFLALKVAEPKAAREAPTFGWVKDCCAATARIRSEGFFNALQTPIRIISAGEEQRVAADDHAVIAALSDRIDHVSVQNALHEIMMEADPLRDAFWAEVDAFFTPALS